MYKQNYSIKKNYLNTATKEASISDETDPVTTCWLMPTHDRVANTFTKKSAKLGFKRLPSVKKIIFLCLVSAKVSHIPSRLFRQIVYTANIDGVWSWAV